MNTRYHMTRDEYDSLLDDPFIVSQSCIQHVVGGGCCLICQSTEVYDFCDRCGSGDVALYCENCGVETHADNDDYCEYWQLSIGSDEEFYYDYAHISELKEELHTELLTCFRSNLIPTILTINSSIDTTIASHISSYIY